MLCEMPSVSQRNVYVCVCVCFQKSAPRIIWAFDPDKNGIPGFMPKFSTIQEMQGKFIESWKEENRTVLRWKWNEIYGLFLCLFIQFFFCWFFKNLDLS